MGNKSKRTPRIKEYTVEFVNVTPNQAQAIELSLRGIEQIKERDLLQIKAVESELEPLQTNQDIFTETKAFLEYDINVTKLIEKIDVQLKKYEVEIPKLLARKKNHEDNAKFIDDMIEKVRSHIHENVDDDNMKVIYTYDKDYIQGFLDLAMVVFEFSVEDKQKPNKNVA